MQTGLFFVVVVVASMLKFLGKKKITVFRLKDFSKAAHLTQN